MTADQQHALIEDYNSKKTFEIVCESGCSVSYKDPRDQLKLPSQTNGWDALNTTVKTLGGIITTAVPYAAIGVIATEGIKASGDNVSGSYNSSNTESTAAESTQNNSINSSYNTDIVETP